MLRFCGHGNELRGFLERRRFSPLAERLPASQQLPILIDRSLSLPHSLLPDFGKENNILTLTGSRTPVLQIPRPQPSHYNDQSTPVLLLSGLLLLFFPFGKC
jgi:hypothetical protein